MMYWNDYSEKHLQLWFPLKVSCNSFNRSWHYLVMVWCPKDFYNYHGYIVGRYIFFWHSLFKSCLVYSCINLLVKDQSDKVDNTPYGLFSRYLFMFIPLLAPQQRFIEFIWQNKIESRIFILLWTLHKFCWLSDLFFLYFVPGSQGKWYTIHLQLREKGTYITRKTLKNSRKRKLKLPRKPLGVD